MDGGSTFRQTLGFENSLKNRVWCVELEHESALALSPSLFSSQPSTLIFPLDVVGTTSTRRH